VTEYRRGRFTTDDTVSFEGWTDGSLWNGWACPAFEKQEADRLAAHLRSVGCVAEFDAAKDAFTIREFDGADLYDPEEYEGLDIETPEGTKRVYAIGAYSWVWQETKR